MTDELPSTVSIWDGMAWIDAPAQVWDGTAFVDSGVKIWNGSVWE